MEAAVTPPAAAAPALVRSLGPDLFSRVSSARLLVVGAGGIGCELLKNLVLTGFRDIEVLDLDTIDASNLNRQFLFRPGDVGKPKAVVAAAAASAMAAPGARIIAHHANIKEPRFGVAFFERFSLVINALDNVSARRHVNRLCLATGRSLVEAGTQGFLGQAYPITGRKTECFECVPPPAQRKYPICTIRSTPDRPVHNVVWAKELHKLMFGDARSSYLWEADAGGDQEAPVAGHAADDVATSPDAQPALPPPRGESVYMPLVLSAPNAGASATDVDAWARALFDALFGAEIVKRLSMADELQPASARRPVPQFLADIEARAVTEAVAAAAAAATPAAPVARLPDQRVLSVAESSALFLSAIRRYFADAELLASRGALEFSKDSPLDVDFVTAASNLRAAAYGIALQSRFDVLTIAGNVVPAIATTNAIVAGLQVIEALKILRGDDILATGRATYLSTTVSCRNNKLLGATKLTAPKRTCYVCGTQGVTVFLDTTQTTLRDFIDKVLVGALNFSAPSLDNNDGFVFEEERCVAGARARDTLPSRSFFRLQIPLLPCPAIFPLFLFAATRTTTTTSMR